MSDNKPKYVVAAPLVYLKVPDVGGALVSYTFYAGSPVPENVDKDSLQHHLDSGLVLPTSDDLAEVLAVPAGTPIPGEPPNVPVTETGPAPRSPEVRLENVKKAAESSPRKSASSSSSSSLSSSSKSE
jgi:hypothetical protein